MECLKIKPTRFHDGERFPVIVSEAGMPQFYPNTFLTKDLRNANKQYNTLRNAAGALQVLRAWELLTGINVVDRMMSGVFLKSFEADSLADALWQKYACLKDRLQMERVESRPRRKVMSLAAFRRQRKREDELAKTEVAPGTAGGRMVYAIRYLRYLGQFALDGETDLAKRQCLFEEMAALAVGLARRSPEAYGGHIDAPYQRLGLTYEAEGLLRQVIEPGHRANPWTMRVQLRNCMVIKILLGLGIRGGELLNLRIEDIDFRTNNIYIRRLPDNPDDPRLYEPNVKTLARKLTMKQPLAAVIRSYIVSERSKLKGSRKHDFLVVAGDDGAPLSRSAFNHIFTAARRYVPGIPKDFCAHMCRHTWNDRYSDLCDKMAAKEGKDADKQHEKEERIRCLIMGWARGSHMARFYTKRSTMEAVDRYLLAQQDYLSDGRLGGLRDEVTFDIE